MPQPTASKHFQIIRIGNKGAAKHWIRKIIVNDGRQLLMRPIDPADAETIRQTFSLLSPEEVRMRFLHPVKELTADLAFRLTNIDPQTQFALVIAEPLDPGEALVGAVARLAIDNGTRNAEFAILVSHFLTGLGFGRMLMKRLIRWGKLKRLDSIYGDVLDENSAMLELAESLGFVRNMLPDEPGIVRVTLDLKPKRNRWPRLIEKAGISQPI